MAHPSTARLLTTAGGALALVLLLSVLSGPALARAAGHSTSPDPSPQPASGSAGAAPSPDPAPQAAPVGSSQSSSSAGTPRADIPNSSPGSSAIVPIGGAPQATVVPAAGGSPTGGGSSTEGGSSTRGSGSAVVAPVTGVPVRAGHRARASAKRAKSVRVPARRIPRAQARRGRGGPNPFEAATLVASPSPSTHREGLSLLLASIGLLVLVAACGSTLRMLVRSEWRAG